MDPVLRGFAAGMPAAIAHFGITIGLLFAGATAHAWLAPHREPELIRAGNTAAALSSAAAVFGLSIPLAAGMASSFVLLGALYRARGTVVPVICRKPEARRPERG